MKNILINVSENANFEINENSLELLLHGVCNSYECDDFRENKCRMKLFLSAIEEGKWEWSQTWSTPEKFFLHILKHGENPTDDFMATMNKLKERWNCLATSHSCNCNFFDEMKSLKINIEKVTSKQSA